jgi:hypothetical protein
MKEVSGFLIRPQHLRQKVTHIRWIPVIRKYSSMTLPDYTIENTSPADRQGFFIAIEL